MRRQEAAEHFLTAARQCLAQGRVDCLWQRTKNRDALSNIGWSPRQVWDLILLLSPADLHAGPLPDLRGDPEDIFIFRADTGVDGYYYLKLKLREQPSGTYLVCLSFHRPDYPL